MYIWIYIWKMVPVQKLSLCFSRFGFAKNKVMKMNSKLKPVSLHPKGRCVEPHPHISKLWASFGWSQRLLDPCTIRFWPYIPICWQMASAFLTKYVSLKVNKTTTPTREWAFWTQQSLKVGILHLSHTTKSLHFTFKFPQFQRLKKRTFLVALHFDFPSQEQIGQTKTKRSQSSPTPVLEMTSTRKSPFLWILCFCHQHWESAPQASENTEHNCFQEK